MGNNASQGAPRLPVDNSFKLPSPLPSWPTGEGFGSGTIDLGEGLKVCQISSFRKVWATYEGGPDNLGASFFEPAQLPQGFFMLGCYSQPNNRPLHGWVLAGKDESGEALKKPIDYTLVWSSQSLKIKQDGIGYIWLPTPPDGYKALGHVVTKSPDKPSLEKIRCVRSELTDQCEIHSWIWAQEDESDPDGFNIFSLWPSDRRAQAKGVSVGTFVAQHTTTSANPISLACLKNISSDFSSMPNLGQIEAVYQAFSPWIYFHPDEKYLPSSVDWYFKNGALLYNRDDESNPVPIQPAGSNLPQGGANDGAYWIDLPVDEAAKERVKKGDLQDTEVYLHVKPMLGATFTDIVTWVFYPFNGPSRAKVQLINVRLGRIGEHIGDWEHVTLRVSNFTGELWSVYLSQHSGGSWIDASELEFRNGNKPVAYTSLNGHAIYSKPGLVLQGGSFGIGIRNDTAKSNMLLNTGSKFSVVSAEYLRGAVIEPPWLNYLRKWGPRITYDISGEIEEVDKFLPGNLKSGFLTFAKKLPAEVLGQDGPTGPKLKKNWEGDEV